jgi:hypothetical protein
VSEPGYVSVSFFPRDDDSHIELLGLLDLLAARPGFRRGQVAAGADDPDTLLLVTEWDGAGWWRRALGNVDVRVAAIPLLARALPGPSSFEVLDCR